MRSGFAAALFCLAAMTSHGDAWASGSSEVTLGVGAGIGIHKAGNPDEAANTAFVNQANLRFKFLYVLGLDYAYDFSRDQQLVEPDPNDLHYAAKMRLTALLYPYNGEQIGFYVGLGLGGGKLGDLGRTDAPANSYHSGLGFEFHVSEHFSIDTSFMLVAPGRRSVENVAVARVEAALAAGDAEAIDEIEAPGIDDFISLKNHEFMVRVFIFL